MADIVVQFRGTIYENGYGQIAQKVMRDKSVHAVAKAIYAYLVSFAGQEGSAFPSVQLMMEELGIKSEDTFYKYRKQLIQAGYISIEQQQRIKGQFYNNVYIIEILPSPKKSSTKESSTKESSTKKSSTIINNFLEVTDLKNHQNNKHKNIKTNVVESDIFKDIIHEIESRLGRPIRSLYKLIPEWVQQYGSNYLISKAEYLSTYGQSQGIHNIVGAYRAAVDEDWEINTFSDNTTTITPKPKIRDERYSAFYELYPDS